MANSVDPNQLAPLGTVLSGSTLFAQAYPSKNVMFHFSFILSKLSGMKVVYYTENTLQKAFFPIQI